MKPTNNHSPAKTIAFVIQGHSDVLRIQQCLDAALVATIFEQQVSLVLIDKIVSMKLINSNTSLSERLSSLQELGVTIEPGQQLRTCLDAADTILSY